MHGGVGGEHGHEVGVGEQHHSKEAAVLAIESGAQPAQQGERQQAEQHDAVLGVVLPSQPGHQFGM